MPSSSCLVNRRTATLISKYIGYFQNFQKRQFASTQSSQFASPQPHHYKTLNIESTASEEDIKKAYNNLMKQWHPDLYMSKPPTQQQEAQSKFLSIREAYQIIISYKQDGNEQIDKMDQKYSSKTNVKRHVPNRNFSYYSWGKKVYETQQNAETMSESEDINNDETEGDEEEQKEGLKYSETYKQNKTWIGRGIEELYDWIVFLYQRNPSWMQFFLIATCCFGIVQGIWHFLNPNINDSDPDRIWNVFRGNKSKTTMSGYLPSSSSAISSTPNLVALQPHFKGHTLYDTTKEKNVEMKQTFHRKKTDDEEFNDVEKKNSFQLFTNLNIDSTVNNADFKKREKKKKKRGDIEVKVIELDIDGEKIKKSRKIINRDDLGRDKQKQVIIDFHHSMDDKIDNNNNIELSSIPIGVLLASYNNNNDEST